MSTNLSQAAVVEFDNLIKDQYQGASNLKPFVDKRLGVVGTSYEFLLRGITEAQQRGAAGTVVPMVNNVYSRPIATLENWVWSTPTDVFQQKEVNFDELSSLADIAVKALGRRADKLIINAALTGTSSPLFPSANAVGDTTTNLTVAKLIAVRERCAAIGVPYNEVTIAISATGLQSLLKSEQITNIFYNDTKPLATGFLSQFLGMRIVTLPDNASLPPDGSGFTGSLPVSTNVVTAFAWHERAIGYAESAMESRVDFVPQNFSYLTTAPLRAGAVAVDPTGLFSIQYLQTA